MNELEQLTQRVSRLEEVISHLNRSDRYTVHKKLQFLDGRNVQTGLTTGTIIGTTVTEKLGFWGKAPVIQPTHANQAALSLDTDVTGGSTVDKTAIDNNFSAIQTLVNQLRSDLVSAGIIKGS